MNVIAAVLRRRSSGKITCITHPISSQSANAAEIVDSIVQAHGLRGLGDGWLEISAADAHAIATAVLHLDLAFQTEIMPFAEAADLATQIFDLAPEPHSYFTNGDWIVTGEAEPATLQSWDPLSDASFDSGVVCVGDGHAVLLWVEDED